MYLAADALHHTIKCCCGGFFQPSLTGAGIALGIGDIKALAPGGDEVRDHLGRVLQIGINHHHRFRPAGVVEPGGERDFLAEIPAEIENGNARIPSLKAQHDGKRSVL